jgi:hypothetical protein
MRIAQMRSIKFLVVFIFLLALGHSCLPPVEQTETPNIPKDSLISPSDLAEYMVEIFLIEAAIYKAQHEGKIVHDYAVNYYRDFFSSNHLTRKRLNQSVEYYIAKKQMEYIAQSVVSKLTEIDLKIPELKGNDSIINPVAQKTWIEKMVEATMQDQ